MTDSHQNAVYFVDFFPLVPSYSTMFMLEAMTYKVNVVAPTVLSEKEVLVEAWSSQCDRNCPEGTWHAIQLTFNEQKKKDDVKKVLSFGKSDIITSDKDFSFTFRLKVKPNEHWKWSHGWEENGYVHVEPPRDNDKWTLGPNYDHILGNVFLGNFIAATNAAECGFTHVLNVADNLDIVYESQTVQYLKIPMIDGAHNPIESYKIEKAVKWLNENDKMNSKILVNCRAGIGRAGSVAVAYVFYKTSMSYEDAYQFVFAKRFVYPHSGLKDILYNLYNNKSLEK